MKSFKLIVLLLLFFVARDCMRAQTINRLPCVNKKFTIVIHIVKDSLGIPSHDILPIKKDIDSLNAHFAPICISFEVCLVDSIDNFRYNNIYDRPNPNHWEEMQVLYNVKNRINIYYVKDITVPAGANGFAGFSEIKNIKKSGIVIKGEGTKTLIHEMGHYFGLSHTFEPSGELVDGSNCATAGDKICDTPADPNGELDGCTFISIQKDAKKQYYNPIVGNAMSYYPDNCLCNSGYAFTHDQYAKMANTYLSNPGMW